MAGGTIHFRYMIRLIVGVLRMFFVFFNHLILRVVHSDCLCIRKRYIVLVLLLGHFGDFFELLVDQYFVVHFLVKMMLEFVCHDHVHVIRRQSTLPELHGQSVIHDVSRQGVGVPLLFLLLLLESFV